MKLNYEPLEALILTAGIAGEVIGLGGLGYNLSKYFSYRTQSSRLETINSKMNLPAFSYKAKEYNKNVQNINRLSSKANTHVFYSIGFGILALASISPIQKSSKMKRNRLLKEKQAQRNPQYQRRQSNL